MTLMRSAAPDGTRVAILEDDPVNRDRWTDFVRVCGREPFPVVPRAPQLADLATFLTRESISHVMCDNRLFERRYARYWGAQAVATSYKTGRGGVLVTAYETEDADLSIRQYRRWIPALVHATELKPSVLEKALLQADREVRENAPPRERMPHRTIMTVRSVVEQSRQQVVKVVMSQWNAQTEVGFPLAMLPSAIQRNGVAPGGMLIAQVNIEATRTEDLFFDEFELPDPAILSRSQTLFGAA